MQTLSPAQAGAIATRGRLLLRRGAITAHQYALLDVMLWVARRPGSAMLIASLTVLARLSGQARSTVAIGLRRLEELGLIQRIRRRVRVAWGGSIASRVVANAYRLIVTDTESGGRATQETPDSITVVEAQSAAALGARRALEEVARRRVRALGLAVR